MIVLTTPDAEAVRLARTRGEFVWLDLVAPDDASLGAVGALLGWHPLLVEDLQHRNQRPKVEDFPDHVFLVTYAAAELVPERGVELLEHALVVHGDYLVTVRPQLEPLTHLRAVLATDATGVSEGAIVHRVLDAIVDTTTAAADLLAQDVDRIERLIDADEAEGVLDQLRAARRELVAMHGMAIAQRDALVSLSEALGSIPGFEVGLRSHFRDITDHARRVVDRIDVSRSLLDGAFEAYYTTLVARQGAVVQRLTVLATIFLPLTFVTGFFGQNFGWMVDNIATRDDFLRYGVGTTIVTALLLGAVVWRLRWW